MAPRPLGSFIPDSVTADVLSFLPKSNVLDFNLISPRAHYIVCEHKVISRDYESVGVSQKGNNIKYYCVSKEDAEKGTFAWRKFDEIGENITKDRLFSFLSVCRSIDSLLWQIDVDDIIIKALKTINIEGISIGECKLYANPDRFEAFLEKFEKPIDLTHVEMDNKLITNDILSKMGDVNIFCSWSRDRQFLEHRRCDLNDDHLYFLDENSQSRNRFKLTGFLTNFTVNSIKEIIKGLYKRLDLGILYQNELDNAIALAKKKEGETSLELYGWNGQGMIRFRFNLWDIGDDDEEMGNYEPMYFDVSLTESSDGQIEMVHPDAVMSRRTFVAFEKLTKNMYINNYQYGHHFQAINVPESLDAQESESISLQIAKISYNTYKRRGSKLMIKYRLSASSDDSNDPLSCDGDVATLVRTDINVEETVEIVKNFAKYCGSIKHLTLELDACRENKDGAVVTSLVDEILIQLAEKGTYIPTVFTASKTGVTMFTVKGIQAIFQALTPLLGSRRSFEYSLGVIQKTNANEIHDWLDHLAAHPLDDEPWIVQRGKSFISFNVPKRTIEDPKDKTGPEGKKRTGESADKVQAKHVKL